MYFLYPKLNVAAGFHVKINHLKITSLFWTNPRWYNPFQTQKTKKRREEEKWNKSDHHFKVGHSSQQIADFDEFRVIYRNSDGEQGIFKQSKRGLVSLTQPAAQDEGQCSSAE